MNNTDLKFFTNEPEATLSLRFQKVLQNAEYFDVLVGYFRSSGFFQLYKSLENVKKIKILVGLNIDRLTYQMLTEDESGQRRFIFPSQKVKENFSEKVQKELEDAEDNKNIEEGIKKFIEFIENKKLEIKVYPEESIHAKVYIIRDDPKKSGDFGRVITGSSNFTESGLIDNLEFNVELKDAPDVKFALKKFQELWEKGIDVSEKYIETVKRKTCLNQEITPYELYLKFLYEYFREKINYDKELFADFPKDYLELDYQKEAVADALDKLKQHNGVFISDVVGLGKTYISAFLAKKLGGRSLIICSPVLKNYWEDIFRGFMIPGYKVESHGKLDKLLEQGTEDYDNVFIDEAHKFRNEITQGFETLHKICAGKKVMLISATPINNRPKDISSQLYLFENKYRSTIPGIKNLYSFFTRIEKRLNPSLPKEIYLSTAKDISEEIRKKILKYVMVRRTRHDIVKYFPQDLNKQGIKFPEVKVPYKLYYQLDNELNLLFEETLQKNRNDLSYARYNPLSYIKNEVLLKLVEESPQDIQIQNLSQNNLRTFMKLLFVKRLESSFFAFSKTLQRFVESYEKFIRMYDQGTVYMAKEIDIYDLLEMGNEEEIQRLVEEGRVVKYLSQDFEPEFRFLIQKDKKIFELLYNKWCKIVEDQNDPKIDVLKEQFFNDEVLKNSKVIVFTESKETGKYLKEKLLKIFPNEVIFISSGYSKTDINKIIENFDPNSKIQEDKLKILIATDILSEGVNLHRANVTINYDIPWNSVKILQRVGRVNRIGSKNDIYIYNFFPTEKAEEEIQLEKLAIAKIQAFHNALGEDAKYLSPEKEVPDSFHLFKIINSKELIEQEEENNELKFLQEIRKIRDKHPDLFEKIKRLPKKARTVRENKDLKNNLITFFRQAYLKKFFLASSKKRQEIDFLEAAKIMESDEKNKITKFNLTLYYNLLNKNKDEFKKSITEEISKKTARPENNVFRIVKALEKYPGLVEEDEEYLKKIKEALECGAIGKKSLLKIYSFANKNISKPLKIFSILKENIPENYLNNLLVKNKLQSKHPKEIILSELFI